MPLHLSRLFDLLSAPPAGGTVTPSPTGWPSMTRRTFVGAAALAGIGVAGYGTYRAMNADAPPEKQDVPKPPDATDALPTPAEFVALAETDPVAFLRACLIRYEREATGFRATLHKQERLAGEEQPPEVLRVAVREKPVAVLMQWLSGGRDKVAGTLYVDGENGNKIQVWRPEAFLSTLRELTIDPKAADSSARTASRYCIADAGLRPTMLRTYAAWKRVQEKGELKVKYEGARPVDELGGRVCHVFARTCVRREVDSFSLDEAPPTDRRRVDRDGYDAVTLYVDADRWLQIGSKLTRKDGRLVGAYYFRDVELNPAFPADQFTPAALKRGPGGS